MISTRHHPPKGYNSPENVEAAPSRHVTADSGPEPSTTMGGARPMQNAILLALVLLLAIAAAVATVIIERDTASKRRELAAITARLA